MRRSVTAALLSGLVFPGAGQFYLKRHVRGALFALAALAALAYLMAQVLGPAMAIADEILAGSVSADPVAIALRLEQRGQGASGLHTLAMLVMLACWLGSTIDAWWLGRAPA